MAFTLAEAVVFFKGDDKQLSSDLDSAKGKTESFVGSATKMLGGALVGGAMAAGAAIVGIGVAGAKSFIDFEQQMNEVFTLLPGISAGAMGDMTAQVKEFSKEFGVLPEEVVPALYQALSAGVPADNVFEFLETANKTAVGGVTDLTTAVDGVSSVVNAYGSDILSAAEASDLMFTTVKLGKTNMEDLSASLFNVTPTAAALGVKFGDVTAALAAMTLQGVPVSVATTQLRQLFVELSQDGGKASKMFQEMSGQTFADFIAGGGDVAGALTLMEQGAENSGKRLSDMFGSVEAGSAALALTGTGAQTFADDITAMGNASGATDTAFKTMDSGIGASINKIQSAWAVFILDIGTRLAPVIKLMVDWAVVQMPKLTAAFDEVGAIVGPIMEGIGTVITTVINVVKPLFTSFGTTVDEASGPLKYLKEWVDTNMPMLQKIFETVLGAIQGFWDLFGEDILHVVNNTFTVISTVIGTVLATIGDTITLFLQIITGDWEGAWETFKGIFERIWETIKTVVSTQLDSLKTIFSNINWGEVGRALLNAVLAGIQAIWVDLDRWVKESLQGLWASITGVDWAGAGKSIVNSTRSGAESVWGNFSAWVKTSSEGLLNYWNTTTWEQKGKDAINAIRIGSEATYSTYKTSISTLIDGLLGFFTGEDWSGTGEKLINDIETGIGNVWNTFTENVGRLATSLGSLFFQLDLSNAGEAIVEAIKTGINDKWEEFTGWFKLKLGELTSLLPFSEPKDSSSPLRNLSKSGKSFVTNWWSGAESEFGSLKANLSGALGNLAGGLGNTPNGSQVAAGGGGGGINITVQVSGTNATYETGRSVGRGINDELRSRGYK